MRKSILLLLAVLLTVAADARDLTFFVVSDTHYGRNLVGDRTVPLLVEKMNHLPGAHYPAIISGTVGKPRGVIHIGDITQSGKQVDWEHFVRDYGLTGSDGRLAFPVYETFGNHDGEADHPVRNGIRERNKHRIGLTAVSENGLHYSWDWEGIHFVNCGICPGTTKQPYDPEHSIEFLESDLKKSVGTSGRPVLTMHHFNVGSGSSWWSDEWQTQYYDQIKGYRVIGILHGHTHKANIYQWKEIDIYHPPHFVQEAPKDTGTVMHGFFVFHITDNLLTVAERKLDDTWGLTAMKKIEAPEVKP